MDREKPITPSRKKKQTIDDESLNNKIDSAISKSQFEELSIINKDDINDSNNLSLSIEDDKYKVSKYETHESTNRAKDSTSKKRKLAKKMNNSYMSSDRSHYSKKDILNETNLVKINEINVSAISIEDKNGNYMTTNGVCLTSEERLRNLVKKCKRSGTKMKKYEEEGMNTNKSILNALNEYSSNSNILEVKNHTKYSNFELSKMIFEILHNTTPDVIVVLPPRYISLPHLIVTNNLRIKGSPGTLVEINNGMIILKDNKIKLSISECSFVFNIETKTFMEKYKTDENLNNNVTVKNGKYYIPLIKSLDVSFIEINDCDFRTIIHEDEVLIDDHDENRKVYDTCFLFPKNKDNSAISQLSLQSTIFSNFYKIIEANDCSVINIDNCHLSDTVSNAVFFSNVIKTNIINSFMNNTFTAIEMIVKNDNNEIKIYNNEFSQNSRNAIRLTGEGSLNILEIRNNTFSQNKHTAILLEKLFIKKFEFNENNLKYNFEIGLLITNCKFNQIKSSYIEKFDESFVKLTNNEENFIDKNFNPNNLIYDDYNFIFIKNTFLENKNNHGLKILNCENIKICIEESNFSYNHTGIGMSSIQHGLVTIKSSSFSENTDNSINICDISGNTRIFLLNDKIIRNYSHGLYISNSGGGMNKPVIFIKNCDISQNKSSGIIFKNVYINIDNSKIIDNSNYSIEIPIEDNKSLIKLMNYGEMLNNNINNPIGGVWGTIANKKSICANGKCFIL